MISGNDRYIHRSHGLRRNLSRHFAAQVIFGIYIATFPNDNRHVVIYGGIKSVPFCFLGESPIFEEGRVLLLKLKKPRQGPLRKPPQDSSLRLGSQNIC
jgi:hypothetical protein